MPDASAQGSCRSVAQAFLPVPQVPTQQSRRTLGATATTFFVLAVFPSRGTACRARTRQKQTRAIHRPIRYQHSPLNSQSRQMAGQRQVRSPGTACRAPTVVMAVAPNRVLFRPHYELQVFVPKVDGPLVGSQVRLNGLPVGKVSKVEFEDHPSDPDRSIRVTLRIEKQYQSAIRTEATARLLTNRRSAASTLVDIQAAREGEPIAAGGEIHFTPTYEPSPMEFIELPRKALRLHEHAEQAHAQQTSAPRGEFDAVSRRPTAFFARSRFFSRGMACRAPTVDHIAFQSTACTRSAFR